MRHSLVSGNGPNSIPSAKRLDSELAGLAYKLTNTRDPLSVSIDTATHPRIVPQKSTVSIAVHALTEHQKANQVSLNLLIEHIITANMG